MVLSSLLATPAIPSPRKENMRGSLEKTKHVTIGTKNEKCLQRMPTSTMKANSINKNYTDCVKKDH